MRLQKFFDERKKLLKSRIVKIEANIKKHPLLYIILALILSPIIVNIVSEALEPEPKPPDPIIFADKIDPPQQLLQNEIYFFKGVFSLYNPSEETLIILNNVIRIPGEWLIKFGTEENVVISENLSIAEKIDKQLSGGVINVQRSERLEESKPYLAEIKPKETLTFPVVFNFKTHNVSGIYSFQFCSVTLRGEFCSEGIYTVFNLTKYSRADILKK